MKVAVLGYGIEGQSAAQYWSRLGNQVTICDQQAQLKVPAGFETQLGPNYLQDLDGFDLIVRQQSIPPSLIKTSRPVTTVIDEFLSKCRVPAIGVTGTKGKGTTVSLIAKILEAASHKVWVGGNIGLSPLDFLSQIQPHDLVVLELSSSQLIDATHSPQVAVCLAVTPDHLNYHADMTEYIQSKANIFRFQKPSDLAIYNTTSPESAQIAKLSPARKLPYLDDTSSHIKEDWVWFGETRIIPVTEVGLVGPHNLENICAAVAATWDIARSAEPIRRAIKAFTGLEHRLELVGEADGVKFYDDSFSTTPETAMAAIKSFAEPKVLILGGSEKGVNYDQLGQAVAAGNVMSVVAIGKTAAAITKSLATAGFDRVVTGPDNMPDIVKSARDEAPAGGVVLLSPACASFDMFKDYKDRGDQFKAAVAKLGGTA